MSMSVPQLTYYSERPTVGLGNDREAVLRFAREPGERFLVLSPYERHPPWVEGLIGSDVGLRPVARFPAGRPEVVVYRWGATP